MIKLILICTVALLLAVEVIGDATKEIYHKYCVVGAGPSGLQLGYYLQKNNFDYMIFEKGHHVGTFYETFPRHGVLISINKRYTPESNTEFSFRHDWNSLVSDDPTLKMTKYSEEYFPASSTLVQYLRDYKNKLNIKVQSNTTVSGLYQDDKKEFHFHDQHGNKYRCGIAVLATGISVPIYPKTEGIELATGYEVMSINKSDYAGKKVMVIGKGNAGFETANYLYSVASLVHVVSSNPIKFAWSTHYVGDLRAINNEILDAYQLKSLDAMSIIDIDKTPIYQNAKGELCVGHRLCYDKVLVCAGFKFDDSLFDTSKANLTWFTAIKPGESNTRATQKYPKITPDYQSVDLENLYYAGTNTHSIDWRKSAGGFIHGFRYTAKTLFNIINNRYEKQAWTTAKMPLMRLIDHIIQRINEASGTYQMFQSLGDVMIIDPSTKTYEYIEEFPLLAVPELFELTGVERMQSGGMGEKSVVVFNFEYGKNFSGPRADTFYQSIILNAHYADYCSFLHPVFYYYDTIPNRMKFEQKPKSAVLSKPDGMIHLAEDLDTVFRHYYIHIVPLRRFLENRLDVDLNEYSSEECLTFSLLYNNVPLGCDTKGSGINLVSLEQTSTMI